MQIAASRAKAMGIHDFGTSDEFHSMSIVDQHGSPIQGAREIHANFDNIAHEEDFRTAQLLYRSGQPQESLTLSDGTVAELHEGDMAVLFVTAGRSMEHVDISVFPSVRALDAAWNDLLYEAGY